MKMNTKAYNKHVVMITKALLRNELEGIILISTNKDGDIMSSHSINIEESADIFRIVGALESMKSNLVHKFLMQQDDEE